MSSNRIIQSLWVSGKLSPMEQLSVASFLAHGHEFHLYAYGSLEGVPEGACVMDAREILPEGRVFQQQTSGFGNGSFGAFSDLFRYKLLWDRGGWWVDTDTVCLRPFDFPQSHVIGSRWEPPGRSEPVNGMLKLPAGDPLAAYGVAACEQAQARDVAYGDLGPRLVARAVRELELADAVVPWTTFCPLGYRDVTELTRPPGQLSWRGLKRLLRRQPAPRIGSESYAVHLWNEMWRQKGLDKNAVYDPRSLYEQLKRRYLSAPATLP